MKSLKTKFLLAASVVLLVTACRKKDILSGQSGQPLTEHEFDLSYVDNFESDNYELIVTDSSGKFLLDTILPVNQRITVKLSSNETKFNMTTIELSSGQYYNVRTYYQVNPGQWNINQRFIQVHQPAATSPTQGPYIFYKDVPDVDSTLLPFPFYTGGNSGVYHRYDQTLRMDYNAPDPYHSYVSIPSLGLYQFHKTLTSHDTVSLARMDTLLSITYPKNFDVSPYNTRELIGYTKKDDYSTYTRLWDDQYDYWNTYGDFVYPSKGVEQYLVRYNVLDDNLQSHYSQVLSDKMPASIEFLDDSYVNVVNKDPNNFEIAFPKSAPSVYGLYFASTITDSLSWQVLLPSTKTNLKGTNKLVDLKKSKLLKTFDFSSVQLLGVQLTKADNYSYYDYLNIIFDSKAANSPQKIMSWMDYYTSSGF